MRFIQYLVASLLFQGMTNGAAAEPGPGHFERRNFDSTRDIHIGSLRSLDDFFERMGTNASDWEPIEDRPEPLSGRAWDMPGVTRSARNTLLARNDQCLDKSGVDFIVCEAMPYRNYIWAAGVTVAIYYTPSILDKFLDDLARLLIGGINLRARFRRQNGGAEGPLNRLKVRDVNTEGLDLSGLDLSTRDEDFEPEYIHFNVDNEMLSMSKRETGDEEGTVINARSYTRYALHAETREIQVRGTDATLSHDASERRRMRRDLEDREGEEEGLASNMQSIVPGRNALEENAQADAKAAPSEKWEDFSLIVTADRNSNYFPDTSKSCLHDWLYERLHQASIKARHSCMHLSETSLPSNYFTYVGVFINEGSNNWDMKFGECCA